MSAAPAPEDSSPRAGIYRLIVRHEGGGHSSYVLGVGHYRLGSSPDSEIRLLDGGVAAVHAVLMVESDGIYLVNLANPESIRFHGGPVKERTQLCPGDAFELGGILFQLDMVSEVPSASEYEGPSDTIALRQRGLSEVERGLSGYEQFQRLIARQVSPTEAEEAQALLHRGLRAVGIVVLAYLGWVLVRAGPLAEASFLARDVWSDVWGGVFLLAACFLVSTYHMNFAGRLLFCLGYLELSWEPPRSTWDDRQSTLGVLLAVLPVFYFLGALVDYGASTMPGRSKPGVRRWTLLGGGLSLAALGVVTSWLEARTSPEGFYPCVFTLGCCCVVSAWGWTIGPAIERRRLSLKEDVLTCFVAARKRWAQFVWGRVLALGLGLFPLFLFLNSLGIQERFLAWPDDPEVLRTVAADGAECAWYWRNKGRFILKSDVPLAEMYAWKARDFPDAEKQAQFLEQVSEQVLVVQSDPTNGEAYGKLKDMLAPYRLTTADDLARALTEQARVTWYLERNVTRPTKDKPEGRELFHAQYLIGLIPFSREGLSRGVRALELLEWPMVICGIIGFIVLWRRGGDSALARWVGLWLVGAAGGLLLLHAEWFMPAWSYSLWHNALTSPLSNLLLLAKDGFEALQVTLDTLNMIEAPLAATWVYLCWPTRARPDRSRWISWLLTAGKIVAVLLALKAAGVASGLLATALGVDCDVDDLSAPLAAPVFYCGLMGKSLLMLVAGSFFRARFGGRTEVPKGGRWLAVALLSSQVTIAGALFYYCCCASMSMWETRITEWVTVGAALLLGFSALSLMLRHNALMISVERDVSFLIVALLLPVAFELSENLAQDLLHRTPCFSEKGASLLGIVIVVLLLGPLWEIIRRIVLLATVRKLRRIERIVGHAIEHILDGEASTDFRGDVAKAFEGLGVSDYVFCARGRGNQYEAVVSGLPQVRAERVEISAPLRRFLARERSFIDLYHVSYEWRFFFYQFELYRLRQATGCRFVLPVCLGANVRGLVLLSDGARSPEISRPAVATELSNLGMAVMEKSRSERHDQPASPGSNDHAARTDRAES